ncbi:MAG: ABC transporter permease subunit [Methanomicrobium sp.]|nr:ABC transporter permease subunit [Methanomicrobium sp.]
MKKDAKSNGLIAISKKEFNDHIRSKKFLIIFAVIMIATITGMASGAVSYNEQIKSYSENMAISEDSAYLSSYWWSKPSVMTIFNSVGAIVASLGAVLGIAMGFDLITREKESKSLKILLSHPIYRDEVINGKAIGGITALVLALLITFVVSIALLLIFSIIPDFTEIQYIMLFGISAFLMIISYFAISLFMSTISENSGNALVYTLIIFIVLTGLFPMLMSGAVMDIIAGDSPEPPTESMIKMRSTHVSSSVSSTVVVTSDSKSDGSSSDYYDPYDTEEWRNYEEELQNYWQKRQAISDFFNLLSPTNNFQYISTYVTYPQIYKNMYSMSSIRVDEGGAEPEKAGIGDLLSDLMKNIIALIAFPAVFLGLSYVKFMRMDIR